MVFYACGGLFCIRAVSITISLSETVRLVEARRAPADDKRPEQWTACGVAHACADLPGRAHLGGLGLRRYSQLVEGPLRVQCSKQRSKVNCGCHVERRCIWSAILTAEAGTTPPRYPVPLKKAGTLIIMAGPPQENSLPRGGLGQSGSTPVNLRPADDSTARCLRRFECAYKQVSMHGLTRGIPQIGVSL